MLHFVALWLAKNVQPIGRNQEYPVYRETQKITQKEFQTGMVTLFSERKTRWHGPGKPPAPAKCEFTYQKKFHMVPFPFSKTMQS